MEYTETIYPDRNEKIIYLGEGEWTPDPTRPGQKIYGPQVIKQTVWKDGGVDTILNYEPEEENQK